MSTTSSETTAIRREIAIAARPETVWEFLVDPDKAVRWMGRTAEMDARPGGVHRVEVISGNIASGVFVELDPPRRLVYTWGWETGSAAAEVPSGSTTIEIELVPDGEGTTVHFIHRDLPSAESAARHAHGWEHYFARFVAVAEGREPGEDPWLVAGGMS